MTAHGNLHHRRAAAAAHRRQPAPLPQLGFNPFPNGAPPGLNPNPPSSPTTTTDDGGLFGGGFTGIFPPNIFSHSTRTVIVTPTSTSTPTSSTIPTTSLSSASTSTTPSTSSTPSSTSTLTTSTTPSTTSTPSITTAPPQTAFLTVTHPSTTSNTAVAAAVSSPAAATGGTSAGVVVGGIAAAVVGIAAIVVAVTFFIRRSRKRDDVDFDPGDFRRSAMPIDDPPTHDDTVTRGFNPRPPTMIERHLASPAPTFGTQYGRPGPAYNHDGQYSAGPVENHAGYSYQQQPSYAPGQIMTMNNVPAAPSPISATSAHPMFNPAHPYGQSPFSPIGSPVSQQYLAPGEGQHEQQGTGIPQPVSYPVLTRSGSSGSGSSHSQEEQHRPAGSVAELKRESAPANDYVDLSRSSVSPFQAAQYVEISKRLNADVPEGLPTPAIERELPPVPPKVMERSPFADPSSAPPSPGGQYAIDRRNLESNDEHDARRASGESFVAPETLEFPVPPSPIHSTTSSRYRIDSLPPTLPEIQIESRVSVGNYPGLRDSGATEVAAYNVGLTPGLASRFPTTPSPLASSFGFPSPSAEETTFSSAGAPAVPAPPPAASASKAQFAKKRASVHSVYDAEDAYGGI